jgi:hypothetical protein
MDIVVGIALVLVGSAIATMGLRLFVQVLPLLAFVSGFFTGAGFVNQILGDRFLGTALGWILGLVLGVIFALAAWNWWYVGVIVAAATTGSVGGSALAEAIGIDRKVVIFLFAVAGAAIMLYVSVKMNMPLRTVIMNTSFAGASMTVVGLMLVFNQIQRTELGEGSGVAILRESWWWTIVWLAFGVVGFVGQNKNKEQVTLPPRRLARVVLVNRLRRAGV